jgi:arylsulfatase A-like enzyme
MFFDNCSTNRIIRIMKREQPNILFLFADQLRADMPSCYGNPVLKTPWFDRMAHEGARCTRAFSSFPLCTPFRASLFTGKYNHSTGVYANHHPLPLEHDFFPELLRQAGYRTGYVGKWHLEGGAAPGFVPPGPRRLGFEHLVGFNRGHYYQNAIYFRDDGKPRHCPRYEPDFQTEEMIAYMQRCLDAKDGRPFFGMLCYGAPHFPFNMPDYLKTLYAPEQVPLGPTALDRDLKVALADRFQALNFPLASGVWGTGPAEGEVVIENEDAIRRYIALYYGMTANVDWNVGRLLNWLDRKGIAGNTLVMLFSDHGDMCGEHGYRTGAKKTAYRQAARIPLLVRWPDGGLEGGRVIDHFIDFAVDAMPTLLEICGLEIPDQVQGSSFLSALQGSEHPAREAVYYEINKEMEGPERFPVPERGVRTAEWLYVRTRQEPLLLIDLIKDPEEKRNLAGDRSYEPVVAKLDAMLADHMAVTNDDWSAEAFFPPENFLDHETKSLFQQKLLKEAIVELAPGCGG